MRDGERERAREREASVGRESARRVCVRSARLPCLLTFPVLAVLAQVVDHLAGAVVQLVEVRALLLVHTEPREPVDAEHPFRQLPATQQNQENVKKTAFLFFFFIMR